jgi:hypothetical protein
MWVKVMGENQLWKIVFSLHSFIRMVIGVFTQIRFFIGECWQTQLHTPKIESDVSTVKASGYG